jgi:RimJ/RimL family protein N-acetyltransferase
LARIEARQVKIKNGRTIIIRNPEIHDAKSLIDGAGKIICEYKYSVTLLEELNVTVEQEEKWIQDHLDHPEYIAIIAQQDKTLVGLLHVETRPRKQLRHVGIVQISVQNNFRRLGIGTELMNVAVEWAKNNPVIDKLALSVFAENIPALNLYKKMQFIEEGRRVREIKSPDGRYFDDILMYRFV